MKPIVEIEGTEKFLRVLDDYGHEMESFLAILISVDKYTRVLQSRGMRLAEALLGDCCRKISNATKASHVIVRIDEKKIGVLIVSREWYRENDHRNMLRDIIQELSFSDMRDIRYSCTNVDHENIDPIKVYAELESGMPPFWQRRKIYSRTIDEKLDIEGGVKKGQLISKLHPVYFVNGDLRGFEVLSRWNHPEKGEVNPSEYIEDLNCSGLGIDLFKANLATAINAIERARREKEIDIICSINIEPNLLVEPDIINLLEISACNINTSQIELEIVEGGDEEAVHGFYTLLQEVKKMGYRIAVDDFGRRYSWINMIGEGVSTVKIGRGYVRGAVMKADGGLQADIVKAVVDTCRKEGVFIVAKGIENREHLEAMKKIGAEGVQGYGICEPLMIDDAFEKHDMKMVKRESADVFVFTGRS